MSSLFNMNYYPEIEKKERAILETKLQTLEELPSGLPIQFLNMSANGNTNVFLKPMTYKENRAILSRIRANVRPETHCRYTYTLDSYFESGGSLALRYKFGTFNLQGGDLADGTLDDHLLIFRTYTGSSTPGDAHIYQIMVKVRNAEGDYWDWDDSVAPLVMTSNQDIKSISCVPSQSSRIWSMYHTMRIRDRIR